MTRSLRLGFLVALTALTTAMVQDHVPGLAELARGSSVIFVGTVASQESRWDRDHRLILTDTRFEVDHFLKGGTGATATITEVGGTAEGTTLQNPARAVYQLGNRYLVFGVTRLTGGVRTYWGPYGHGAISNGQVDLLPGTAPRALPQVLVDVRANVGVRP
jgi:hypothetical protein